MGGEWRRDGGVLREGDGRGQWERAIGEGDAGKGRCHEEADA